MFRNYVATWTTRLRKAKGDGYDGAILAVAGLMRMGLEGEISEHLSPEEFVPAPGQGALAVEVRDGDTGMDDLMAALDGPRQPHCSRN